MEKRDFHSSITVSLSPKKVFDSIGRVREWWTQDFEGNSAKMGDVFTVRFGDTFVTFRITEEIAGKKIAWKVIDCNLHWLHNKKEWKGTQINWEVETTKSGTQISFTHMGLLPEVECYSDCVKGWTFYVNDSLFKLLTDGKGLPEKLKHASIN